MIDPLKHAVSLALGGPIRAHARTAGGDINDAFDVTMVDGRRVFVKTHPTADPVMFACEAYGLEWLREADALRLPRVLAHSNAGDEGPGFLALERIAPAPRAADFDERLGRGLADLHRFGAPAFGLAPATSQAATTREARAAGRGGSNFIGSLPQDNTPADAWPAFYVTRRLEPQMRAAIDGGRAPAGWTRAFARLFGRMADLAGPPEPPARLHGDLWGGNVMADEHGAPCLIDPAVYGGHREIDLAMLRLFGGLGSRCLAAYHERFPLAAGHEARVPLYQLYPLLVHVNLFGGSYVDAADRALRRYL